MELSRNRESELVEQNLPKIYRAVDTYMARCNQNHGVMLSYDDCVQEVACAFLKYIRRCETEAQLKVFPWHDAMHAMSELVILNQPLSVPKTTKRFKEVIHSLPKTVPFDVLISSGTEIDGLSGSWVSDLITLMDFDDFMSSQTELENRIAAMRGYGVKFRDIEEQLGIPKSSVCDILHALKKKYYRFRKE